LLRSYLLPAFYLLGRRPITIMGVTTDTAITATTIGITTTTIIIVTGLGLPLSTVAPATTAIIETSPPYSSDNDYLAAQRLTV
jgi:hypothetical protein